MIRKTLTFISLIVAALCSVQAYATEWYKYPMFCYDVDNIIETSNKVFYLSDGNLYSYSPADDESYAYTQLNKLNDAHVSAVYYNNAKRYIVLVYDNSNMDVITDSGEVINLPEIKDASLSTSKKINDVAFGDDRIAIATDFGIVVYDDNRFEVVESGIYNKVINCIGIMNGHLLIYGHSATKFTIMSSPLNIRHNNLEKFTALMSFGTRRFRIINDEIMVIRENNSNKLVVVKVNLDTNKTQIIVNGPYHYDSDILAYKNGFYTLSEDKIIIFDNDNLVTYDIPQELRGDKLAFYDDPNKVWSANSSGISRFDISTATPTMLNDRILYNNYITDKRVTIMKWSADNKRLYISNMETTNNRSFSVGHGSPYPQTTNIIEDGWITDVSLMDATATHAKTLEQRNKFNNKRMYGDPVWVIEDPDDTDKYYCANYFEGLFVIKRNPQTGEYEEIGLFNETNSPMVNDWGPRTMVVDIDKMGNLWMGYQFGGIFSILPAEKRKADPKTITKDDWVTYTQLEDHPYRHRDLFLLLCKKSNMAFYMAGSYEDGFMVIDTKGTYDNPADDTIHQWSTLIDQDGNSVNYVYCTVAIEDDRGCVWIGTNAGVFEVTNPSNATDPSMRIRRIKVPRNDGTNYADYLLDTDFINWMALDPAGRKWIATDNSGLYLVSETGDKIIAHYDKSNSPLATNCITSVECDKKDNTVYIGTTDGLYSLKSDASPAKPDYSEIYAYPNPVRPEYSGMVTITGLMDRSVVKITDTVGNVVFETRSEGGMAIWDACDPSGDRVKSGVYYVYASQYDGSTSTGAVTKILVIN